MRAKEVLCPPVMAVASGKGGTGKTFVATNLAAHFAQKGLDVVVADCDVEEPNSHLFLDPSVEEVEEVLSPLAVVDAERCESCGACRDACRFGAIRLLGGEAVVFPELCHGCGACVGVCPTRAIHLGEQRVGEVHVGSPVQLGQGTVTMVTGLLDIGRVEAPDVIRATRQEASFQMSDVQILDAPPGVACAAVASIRGADMLLLVAEPTAFGIHDLELTVRLGKRLDLPMALVANRVGLGSGDLQGFAAEHDIPLLVEIPHDREIAATYARGDLIKGVIDRANEWFEAIDEGVREVLRGVGEDVRLP